MQKESSLKCVTFMRSKLASFLCTRITQPNVKCMSLNEICLIHNSCSRCYVFENACKFKISSFIKIKFKIKTQQWPKEGPFYLAQEVGKQENSR